MDFNDPKQRAIFFEVHDGLPRQGPGSFECTKRALALCRNLPAAPRVLDIACGPGMQTVHLAQLLPSARITAFDTYAPFLEELTARAEAEGVADRIEAKVGDMTKLDKSWGTYDLIWCEGAAYIMGVKNALNAWKPLLAPGGNLALTEAVWLRSDPPEPVRHCWLEYPEMKDIAYNKSLVTTCGYTLLGDFVLPESAWVDDYYGPMAARLAEIGDKYTGDIVAEGVLAECHEEVNVYRQYSDYYSYVFLVMTPA